MKKTKISIIIPIYNVEKYLNRCLDSLKNQTFQNWEAVCIDDGATDNSGKIAEEYAKKDKRFIVIHKENEGQSKARNIGLGIAKGEYILFLDSDDFIHPQTLEILNFYADKNAADMVVFYINRAAQTKMIDLLNDGMDVSKYLPLEYYDKYDITKIKNRVTNKVLFHSTEKNHDFGSFRVRHCYPVLKMCKRDLIKSCRFIENIIIEDFPWWTDILFKQPKTVILKAPLYFYTPNMKSSLHVSKDLFLIKSIYYGLKYVHSLCIKKCDTYELNYYNRNFLWPFIIILMRTAKHLTDPKDIKTVVGYLKELDKKGVFDKPQTFRARKYKHRIEKFISQIS